MAFQQVFSKIGRFFLRGTVATILVLGFFVLFQDFLIFPGLYDSVLFNRVSKAPPDIEALTTTAQDGSVVKVWRLRVEKDPQRPRVALLFHGNGENLSTMVHTQRWLAHLGISSYSVEYRGYDGWKSGWPSEQGFYADADAALNLILQDEQIDPKNIVLYGSSIGTGTAAYIAQKYNVGTLVLLSPYYTLTDLIGEYSLFKYLVPFVRYKFPTADAIEKLSDTCVVAAHGRKDSTIPFHHSERLKQSYRGKSTYSLIVSEQAGHNDLLGLVRGDIAAGIERCTLSR